MQSLSAPNNPSYARWFVIALFMLVFGLYGLWRLSPFAPDTARAKRGVAEFQAYLAKGSPIPATTPNGSGQIWSEQGFTFFDLGHGAGIGFYYDVLCKSATPLKLGTSTKRGVVISCDPIANDIYWLVLKN